MRGLFLHGLTSLMGEVVRGVTKSTSRMKESVLFHEEEEEKKHTELKKQMETRNKKAKEVIDKSKVVIAHLKRELEGKDKRIKENEEELKTRDKRAKENEEKNKEEVAQLKGELEERDKKIKENEEKNKKEVAHLQEELEGRDKKIKENEEKNKKEVAHLQKSFHIRFDRLQKKLDNKDEVIGKLEKHNAGLNRAFDFNAGVNMEIESLDAKIEEANLEARNLKRSREDLEVAVGPEMKKVCAAVVHLRNGEVDTGLKMLEASANIIAPALAMSKNQKRRARRAEGEKKREREEKGGDNGLKGKKYSCGICKDFFTLAS